MASQSSGSNATAVGFEAARYLTGNNCAVGSTIRLQSRKRGKFGRILGVIYSGDDTVSINDRMIEEGFAVPYTGGNKDELDALHEANKQKLIEKGLL